MYYENFKFVKYTLSPVLQENKKVDNRVSGHRMSFFLWWKGRRQHAYETNGKLLRVMAALKKYRRAAGGWVQGEQLE